MISIKYVGRFGNNLFQFATAKIVSDKIGVNILNPLDTKILPHANEFPASVDEVITLSGFFQSQKVIKNFAALPFIKTEDKDAMFVHVRLGDLLEPYSQKKDRFASEAYYEKAINNTSGGFISSDSPDHPMVRNLAKKFNLEFFNDSPENTIIFGARCSKKVLSLGTFSWWIGYLGNQNNVICPNPKEYGVWHGDIYPQNNWTIC